MFENYMFLKFLTLRLLIAIIARGVDHPDESLQSVEVAHKMVFGPGHLTWEWVIDSPIRSIAYPALFAFVFQALKMTGLDTLWLIATLPRLTQAIISACGDYCFLTFFRKTFSKSANYFVFFYALNGWMMYVSSRTLSNTMEMNLNCIALLYYSKALERKGATLDGIKYVALVTISFATRPSTALFWLPSILYHIAILIQRKRFWSEFALKMLPTACLTLLVLTVMDSVYYGRFVFVPWNFFRINILVGVSSNVYGEESVAYYALISLPLMLNLMLPFLPVGIKFAWKDKEKRIFVFSTLWTFLCLSCTSHKETRFLTPIVPLLLALCSHGLTKMHKLECKAKILHFKQFLLVVYFALNLVYAMSKIDVSGIGIHSSDLLQYLATEFDKGCLTSVFFLYCLPVPLYSHFHRNASLDALHCSPVWGEGDQVIKAVEQPELTSSNVEEWLLDRFGPDLTNDVPSYVVVYEYQIKEWPVVEKFFYVNQMARCNKIGTTHVYSKCC